MIGKILDVRNVPLMTTTKSYLVLRTENKVDIITILSGSNVPIPSSKKTQIFGRFEISVSPTRMAIEATNLSAPEG